MKSAQRLVVILLVLGIIAVLLSIFGCDQRSPAALNATIRDEAAAPAVRLRAIEDSARHLKRLEDLNALLLTLKTAGNGAWGATDQMQEAARRVTAEHLEGHNP